MQANRNVAGYRRLLITRVLCILAALALNLSLAAPARAAPIISGTPASSVAQASAYSFTPTVSDPGGGSLNFSIANKPLWMSFNSSTGTLSGTPGYSTTVETYANITISVRDSSHNSASLSPFSITVTKTYVIPTISGNAPSNVVEGKAYSFTPSAHDVDGDTLSFSVSHLPSWASFNSSTGTISGTPGYGTAGTYSNVLIITYDGGLSASLTAFTITVIQASPTIAGTPPATGVTSTVYTFKPTAASPDGLALTFSATNLPSWLILNSSTGALTGVPISVATYSNITESVSDGTHGATLGPFTIKVSQNPKSVAPALAFVLTSASDSTQDFNTYFTDPNIDGVALQVFWSTYEPTEGSYGWTTADNNLDQVLAAAQAAGKRVTIHMFGGTEAPSWLAADGAQYYLSGLSSYIVPWDPVYLSKYETFMQALASHIAAEGYTDTIFDISLVVPENEMTIEPVCVNGALGLTTPYNRTSYFEAWQQVGAVLQSSFPGQNKFVSAPGFQTICGAQDPTFYSSLLTDLHDSSSTFWMFAADLDAADAAANTVAGSGRATAYLSTFMGATGIAYQMIGSSTAGTMSGTYPGNLKQALCAGLASGGQYLEVYSSDVLNTNSVIQSAIQAIHKPSLCT